MLSKKTKFRSGFSLIELLVSISIMMIVSAITFNNFPGFKNRLALDILVQDIAISIRQAQVYGTTVFGSGATGQGGQQFQAYGAHFPPISQLNSQGFYEYLLFADLPDATNNPINYKYDEGTNGDFVCGVTPPISGNECFQKFVLSGKEKIDSICINYFNNNTNNKYERMSNCEDPTNLNKLDSLDVVFKRPNLDAKFTAMKDGGKVLISNAGVVVRSSEGETRTIVVWENGQISIDK